MAYDLQDKLVIAISSRALFDLEEENAIFDKEGLESYYKHQLENYLASQQRIEQRQKAELRAFS